MSMKLRKLPQVDTVLRHPCLQALALNLPQPALVAAVRTEIDERRTAILDDADPDINAAAIAQAAACRLSPLSSTSLRRVINATGIIIHTNLGRSVLAPEAVTAVEQVASGYSTLEYDTDRMARGSRSDHCEPLISTLCGSEAALAVNNNAAAVLLVLTEFSAEREAVISRGELVEIGGSFRIPDIMALSGARMVEVGTTNKTHLDDYHRAITGDTGILLKVHPSNYRMSGFTASVSAEQLRNLVDDMQRGQDAPVDERILVFEDLGSGALIEGPGFIEHAEPTVSEVVQSGADLVSFSGDKLLGGPQAGIIVGTKALIDRLKANPLSRALRLDKMTLAALEATLHLYLQPARARSQIPTLRMLEEPLATTRARAGKLQSLLAERLTQGCAQLSIRNTTAQAGGGALPLCDIPSCALELSFSKGDAQTCEEFLEQWCPTPIIARINQGAVLFDMRTIVDDDDLELIAYSIADYFKSL